MKFRVELMARLAGPAVPWVQEKPWVHAKPRRSKIPGRGSGGTRQPAEDFGGLADRLNEIAGSQGNERLGASHAA
ncbi:MAG: hypothetical protein O7A08_08750 [SAR324 cluster bacterium]|nr:hypothetical protein [SAR324 cluster bacterium]